MISITGHDLYQNRHPSNSGESCWSVTSHFKRPISGYFKRLFGNANEDKNQRCEDSGEKQRVKDAESCIHAASLSEKGGPGARFSVCPFAIIRNQQRRTAIGLGELKSRRFA